MADINDVRKALWAAYEEARKTPNFEGKSDEALCSVQYPAFWDAETEEDFCRPTGVMVYSYALGPSREHYFLFGKQDRQINYYTWRSPDPYAKAVEVIGEWMKEFRDREAEDAA